MAQARARIASAKDLRRYAKAVAGARADFERLYDAQAALQATPNLPFKVVALGIADDASAYHAALEEAQTMGWLRPLLIALAEAGLFAASPAAAAAPAAELVVQVQAMLNPDAGMLRPERLPQGLVRSMKQVCRVLVDDGAISQGSGFLVGPQTVITCYHVIGDLVQDDKATPGSESRLLVEFDDFGLGAKAQFTVQKDWLAVFRRCGAQEKPKTNGEARYGILSKADLADPTLLDFAIIRLAGTPGRERGYQRLDDGRWPETQKRMWVFQHPLQFSQRLSDSPTTSWHDPKSKLRLVHSANSTSGSSGGMCTNDAFDAVALHQCTMRTPQKKPLGNGAVPIARIASTPESRYALEVNPRLDPLWQLPGSAEPVFGREDFQQRVWEVVEGKGRVLVVRGGKECGKSFTKQILKGLLPQAEHSVVELSAASLPAVPQLLATAILNKIEAPAVATTQPLPDASEAATTDAAWIKDVLFPAFHKRLTDAAGSRTVWIVIDDLNHHTIPDTGARTMLELLYQQLPNLPSLRVVLIGLVGTVPAVDWSIVTEYSASEITDVDVKVWLERYGTEKSVAYGQEETERLSKLALDWARREQANWLVALPQIVVKRVAPILHSSRG